MVTVHDFTDDNSIEEVCNDLQSGKETTAVILFGADWNDSCKILDNNSVWEALEDLLEQSNNGINSRIIMLGRVNVDASPVLAQKFEVSSVPTFVVLGQAAGHVVGRVVVEATMSEHQVLRAIQKVWMNFTNDDGLVLNKWSR